MLPTTSFLLLTTDCLLLTTHHLLPTTNHSSPATHHLLPTTNHSPPAAYYLLLYTTCCLLLTTHHTQLTTYYLLLRCFPAGPTSSTPPASTLRPSIIRVPLQSNASTSRYSFKSHPSLPRAYYLFVQQPSLTSSHTSLCSSSSYLLTTTTAHYRCLPFTALLRQLLPRVERLQHQV